MKIIKKGEQKYYYGKCEDCGTEILCKDDDDRDLIVNFFGTSYIKCPICANSKIKITTITKEEHDRLSNSAEYNNVGIRNPSEN